MTRFTRRHFVGGGAALATSLAFPAILRATRRPSDEIRVAVAGLRGRGRTHIRELQKLENVRVVALCDVDRRVLEATARRLEGEGVRADTVVDVREVLDRDDIDVLAIATPNHWHALMTVWACQAGKDVYVEKPVSHNVWEGRQSVRAAERYGRIVQTGTQIRSSLAMAEAFAWLGEGHLGKIRLARGLCYKPRQSIGKVNGPQTVDPAVDYDLWTGPAPMEPLRRERLHYDWHWVFDTGNGDLGNQGVHQVDLCRWVLGERELSPRVIGIGGRFGYDDDGNTPNTLLTYHDYPGAPLLFEVRGLPRNRAAQEEGWGEGMDAYMETRIGVIVHCEGGYLRIPSYTEAEAYDSRGRHLLSWKGGGDHFENFIHAVRSRRAADLHAPILEGHLSSALCHASNISYLRGRSAPPEEGRRRLDELAFMGETYDRFLEHLVANGIDPEKEQPVVGPWLEMDPESERFRGDQEANRLLTRPYREPFVVPAKV